MIELILIRELRRQLTGRDGLIIRLYFDYGYREREIGEMMKISQGRVNQIKRRALEKLRE